MTQRKVTLVNFNRRRLVHAQPESLLLGIACIEKAR